MISADPFNPTPGRGSVDNLDSDTDLSFNVPLSEIEGGIEDESRPQQQFRGLTVATALIMIALGYQCFHLQVLQGSQNRAYAEQNSIRIRTIDAGRGIITDDTGTVLAQNTERIALVVTPQNLPVKLAARQAVYVALQKIAHIDNDTIALIEANHKKATAPYVLQNNLSKDTSLLYKEQFSSYSGSGVAVQEAPIRNYADLPSLSQLIGYVSTPNKDEVKAGTPLDQLIGKTGLEATYNKQLNGEAGHQKVAVDAYGKVDPNSIADVDLPIAGATLKLSIDANLQKIVAGALADELARRQIKFGNLAKLGASAVLLDPYTGAVKAMVSLPDYSANLFSAGISKDDYNALLNNPGDPLLNRAIQGQFQSGSVIKPLIAASALDAGVIGADQTIPTPDKICVSGTCFPDWKSHGSSDVRKAIAQSNNVFFYQMGGGYSANNIQGLGIDRLDAYLRSFGLGAKTGVDIPGEATGVVPSPDYKKKLTGESWYIGDTYNSSIGQGYTLVTPLQMATATAALVNGGTVWQPILAWSTIDAKGTETLLPRVTLHTNVVKPSALDVVKQGMYATTQPGGSAHYLGLLNVKSAGKTGTAQFGNQGLTHAWYTGFAPYDKPQYVFSILIEGGGESYESSVPVAEEMFRGIFNEPLADGQKLSSEPGILAPDPNFQGER